MVSNCVRADRSNSGKNGWLSRHRLTVRDYQTAAGQQLGAFSERRLSDWWPFSLRAVAIVFRRS